MGTHHLMSRHRRRAGPWVWILGCQKPSSPCSAFWECKPNGMWVLQGRSSLTRVPQDFNGSREVPPCRVDAEGEAAGFAVTHSCSHRRLGVDPPTGLGPLFSTTFLLLFLLSFLPQTCSIPRKQGQWPRDRVTSGVKVVSMKCKQSFQGCSDDQICDGTDSLTRPA